jgi:hypothetical protein
MATTFHIPAKRRSVDHSFPFLLDHNSKDLVFDGIYSSTQASLRRKSPDRKLVALEAEVIAAASSWKAPVEWCPQDSSQLYNVEGWGGPYFSVGDNGNLFVTPKG